METNECPESAGWIEKLVVGEISDDERAALERHAQECATCSQIIELHGELEQVGQDVPMPPEAYFRMVRRNVMARADAAGSESAWQAFWRQLTLLVRAQPAAAMLMAAVVLLGAFWAGRWSGTPRGLDDELLVSAIRQQAAGAIGGDAMSSYWDAPFAYTNVTARPVDGGRLALSFDVSRHIDLVTAQDSDVARDVLLHAILDPSPMGSRLRAMGLTGQIMDQRLLAAVILSMHHDPELAVRLEALEVLTRYPFDPTIQNALLITLERDASVQMRMRALEHLAAQQVSGETLRQSITGAGQESDDAIMHRADELVPQL